MRPVKLIPHTSGYTTLAFPLVLTKAETEAFHKACKMYNRNTTPVITSILLLSDVETTLWWGRQEGPDKFDVVKNMFETADKYFIPINGMDRVSKPSYYSSLNIYFSDLLPLAISLFTRAY